MLLKNTSYFGNSIGFLNTFHFVDFPNPFVWRIKIFQCLYICKRENILNPFLSELNWHVSNFITSFRENRLKCLRKMYNVWMCFSFYIFHMHFCIICRIRREWELCKISKDMHGTRNQTESHVFQVFFSSYHRYGCMFTSSVKKGSNRYLI